MYLAHWGYCCFGSALELSLIEELLIKVSFYPLENTELETKHSSHLTKLASGFIRRNLLKIVGHLCTFMFICIENVHCAY